MTTATKTKVKKEEVSDEQLEKEKAALEKEIKEASEEVDEQVEVFEPVALSVERKLTHPDTGEERTFIQHEMGFLTKLKFFRLLSGTIRLAADDMGQGFGDFLNDLFGSDQVNSDSIRDTLGQEGGEEQIIVLITRLVELVPDFIEETYVLALNARPQERVFVIESLDSLSDDEGFDILDVFIAQNGKAIRRFFDQHLRKISKRFAESLQLGEGTEQE